MCLDRFTQHRYKCDQSFELDKNKSPVAQYLDIDGIVEICLKNGVQAVHPGTYLLDYVSVFPLFDLIKLCCVFRLSGYGFLSENEGFAKALEDNGIVFIGPTVKNLQEFGDKTAARHMAIANNVPVVPGSEEVFETAEEMSRWIDDPANNCSYPVIVKALMGGGGRGIRVARFRSELASKFREASNEAASAVGDGRCFVEKYVEHTRHIEVQCIGDGQGNVIHLWDRDCSVQRRHQKVIEVAPAEGVPPHTRAAILNDAVRLLKAANYRNAGTGRYRVLLFLTFFYAAILKRLFLYNTNPRRSVEFLVENADSENPRYYFMEVNPRVQVEHTVTEEVTGYDMVQTQILIASGRTLPELGLTQDCIPEPTGCAMQCRVTTEDPSKSFRPGTGRIDVLRMPAGNGIRLDDGPGFQGATITPWYDSLLVKITARARTRKEAAAKMTRALREFRVRGGEPFSFMFLLQNATCRVLASPWPFLSSVKTNKSFLLNVLQHPQFLNGVVDTSFIGENPQLLLPVSERDRADKLLHYLATVIVNGPPKSLGATGAPPCSLDPIVPSIPQISGTRRERTLKCIFDEDGPEAFAKAIRENKGLLITDTTWRDAHQSLLATRVRTTDLLKIAPATKVALANACSLECWGGATFDVSLRFLHECPWERLAALRKAVPNIPLQMLLRGANAVGYTNYPDNLVYEFCKKAKETGIDIFRIFDSLNYIENMKLGIDAVHRAGGVVEAALCYTGDITDPHGKYTLEYYLDFVRQLTDLNIHILGIKDMAGLLKPEAATMLVGAIRKEFPDLPIHVHTHDTAGTGVASMLAAARAGADVVDAAIDAMSGTSSQPSLGAIVASTAGTSLDTGLDLEQLKALNEYWEECRRLYSPFESGLKTGSVDVYDHEMPGGQYTNLLFQSSQLGLSGQWSKVKKAYASANRLLGDIIKVTPSSKVVGDLAQFLVANDLSEEEVIAKAESLSFPKSVVEYFQGAIGLPPFGFPEPLRSKVLKEFSPTAVGKDPEKTSGRARTTHQLYDMDVARANLEKKWKDSGIGHVKPTDGTVFLARYMIYRIESFPLILFLNEISFLLLVRFSVEPCIVSKGI